MDHILGECHRILSKTASVIVFPFLGLGLLAMDPTLVVAPWKRLPLRSRCDFDPSRSSAALWENKFDVHPDTPHNDPILARNDYFWDIDPGTLIQVTWHVGRGMPLLRS